MSKTENLVEKKNVSSFDGKTTATLSPFFSSLEIVNYQSIERLFLELGMFNVIHGESDVGKSAVFRAFSQLCEPDSGDSFITHGKDKSSVSIMLKSGEVISWSKNRNRNPSYKLDENSWRHVSSVPKDILHTLKISKVVVGDDYFCPGVQGQFDGLFLLFDSSLKRAKTLGSIISNILLSGIRDANLERNRNESDIRGTEILLAELEKVEKIDWSKIDEQILLCDSLQVRTKKLVDLAQNVGQGFLCLTVTESNKKEISDFIDRFEIFDKLVIDFYKYMDFYSELKNIYDQVKNILDILKEKEIIVDTTSLTFLERLVSFKSDINELYDTYRFMSRDYDLLDKGLERYKDMVVQSEQNLKKAEQDFLIKCPYCKKKFSLFMVKE